MQSYPKPIWKYYIKMIKCFLKQYQRSMFLLSVKLNHHLIYHLNCFNIVFFCFFNDYYVLQPDPMNEVSGLELKFEQKMHQMMCKRPFLCEYRQSLTLRGQVNKFSSWSHVETGLLVLLLCRGIIQQGLIPKSWSAFHLSCELYILVSPNCVLPYPSHV